MRVVFVQMLLLALLSPSLVAVTYDVPVPPELAGEARWDLSDASARIDGNQLTVHYRLPVGLVGATVPRFGFTGTIKGSFVNVEGSDVYGVCMLSVNKPMACSLKYPGLEIDEVSRDEALKKNFSGNSLDLRKRTVRLFKDDPAGLLQITP